MNEQERQSIEPSDPVGLSPMQRGRVIRPAGGADLLAIGFGTTVAMWVVGYVGRMPGAVWPSWLLAAALLGLLLAGGFVTGRSTGRGWPGGLVVGIIVAFLNLLIVGAAVSDGGVSGGVSGGVATGSGEAAREAPSAWLWVPGTLVITAMLTTGAAGLGTRWRRPAERRAEANWTCRFAGVAAVATGLLLVVGGLVTGREAGLAVPDWPTSYGYNMFLYPMARMTGNIYYEHAHRLYGALIGLTTIVLMLHLWRHDSRRWLRWLMVFAVVAVIAQGVMGALRVTGAEAGGGVEVAGPEHETAATSALRVAHGVFAQVFFGLMVAVAGFTSTRWRSRAEPHAHPGAGADRSMAVALLLLLVAQLVLGALVRHLGAAVMLHILTAALIAFVALAAGMRAWGIHGDREPLLKRLGVAAMGLVLLQLTLGLAALIVTGVELMGSGAGSSGAAAESAAPGPVEVGLTTAHQANGAALLAVAVLLVVFTHRLLKPAETERDAAG